MSAIFRREFRSYFTSPIGYVFVAVLLFFEGLTFSVTYRAAYTDIMTVFNLLPMILAIIIPVITMRTLSEDRKLKVDQALFTAPVTVGKIVMGKFFAAFTVFALPLFATVIFQFIIASKVATNWLLYFNALVGILLLGAALIAIGMFISSLTESSVISCILTLVIFLVLTLVSGFAALSGLSWVVTLADYFALFDMYSNFTEAVFHVKDVVYLLTVTGVFCFLTVRAVEKRRWA
jgi:ABC-2 type transport system permease protein